MTLQAQSVDPLGYHVLLEMKEVEETTSSGIVLTQSVVNREQAAMVIGKVIKIGPWCYKNHASGCDSAEDWGFSVGDWVQFSKHAFVRVAGEKSNLVYVLDYDIKGKVTA